jgi:hypothetical protein
MTEMRCRDLTELYSWKGREEKNEKRRGRRARNERRKY